jgi:methylase of polypeptide subunit release factors
MTPSELIEKWRNNQLSEQAGAQAFFLDLCDVLGVDKPNDPDNYCFERGATRTGAGHGWADVWKRNCFAWENKGPNGDLSRALKQLMTYALALDNPPLLIVCNRALIEIHTHFTGTPSEIHTIRLEEIGAPENLQKLRWVFTAPDKFKPDRTVLDVTREAAGRFADLAQSMQSRGHSPEKIAHFLIQCLFAMFAEDAGLLPEKLFQRIVSKSAENPEKLAVRLGNLFESMQVGGDFMLEDIAWFNGGLFQVIEPIPLVTSEVKALLAASNMNWSHIEPSIFGTMFERGLDPAMRSQLGANYTDPGTIGKLIDPVIVRPLAAEWEVARAMIAAAMAKYHAGGKGSQAAHKTAQETFLRFIERLKNFRVLDPACGSGNFLYLALRALKNLEHRANLEVEAMGLQRQLTIDTSPANVLGIEINAYAAELARVTVWIGEIQWMLKNGYDIQRQPILAPLNHIECRDAILNADRTEAEWPKADAIVGNPPFIGGSKKRGELGDAYFDALATTYDNRVPPGADLVCYWFEKARTKSVESPDTRVGLVATNSIRGGANREVLKRICSSGSIFEAWSDEPWINDGAAVRVSLICFASARHASTLDGVAVAAIHADLTAGGGLDLTLAKPLQENIGASFQGASKKAKFEIPASLARTWLAIPNPNGRPNSDVVKPWANGFDLSRRPQEHWIIDFGTTMTEIEAALYEMPFTYVTRHVKPDRLRNNREAYRKYWWRLAEPRPGLRAAIKELPRFIATIAHSKYRFFVWLPIATSPDQALITVARADEATFGILHSRFHELWSLRMCTWLGVGNDPRYTPTTTFETFPFPIGMTPRDTDKGAPAGPKAEAIAAAALNLNSLRENWLNPPEWVDRVPEVVAGYPDRIVAKPGHEAELKKRTLTNLYNARPAWLDNAHKTLDAAVAQAYGWTDYTAAMPDEEILRRLLDLNLQRATKTRS